MTTIVLANGSEIKTLASVADIQADITANSPSAWIDVDTLDSGTYKVNSFVIAYMKED
jgi:hypothetical protein